MDRGPDGVSKRLLPSDDREDTSESSPSGSVVVVVDTDTKSGSINKKAASSSVVNSRIASDSTTELGGDELSMWSVACSSKRSNGWISVFGDRMSSLVSVSLFMMTIGLFCNYNAVGLSLLRRGLGVWEDACSGLSGNCVNGKESLPVSSSSSSSSLLLLSALIPFCGRNEMNDLRRWYLALLWERGKYSTVPSS